MVSDFYIHSDTHPNQHLLYGDTVSDSLRKYVNTHLVGARFDFFFLCVQSCEFNFNIIICISQNFNILFLQ